MMNKRKVTAIMISATLASVTLAGNVMAQNEYPTIDFNNTTVYGDVGPDGSVPGGLEDVQLTDEEIQKVKDGNFKVAICYHQLDNQVNQSKLSACQEVLEELGIEVVAVTDAQSDAVKEVDQLETALALNPDALLSMPYDVEVTKAAYQKYIDAEIPVVFMENASADFTAGEDYVAVTNSDSYGNGMFAAMLLAESIGYEGKVAMVYSLCMWMVYLWNKKEGCMEMGHGKHLRSCRIWSKEWCDSYAGTNRNRFQFSRVMRRCH